ncbi:hypothetical protein [Streptomyces sp. NPDC054887]
MTDMVAGAVQPPLWSDGWETEPCDTAAADEQAHLDLHAPRRQANAFDTDPWHGYARPATRPARKFNPYRDMHDVLEDL